MSTYAISDIHGCYDEFQHMLDKIGFSNGDRLILGGDYIDRGPKNLEMLRWLERRPDNVISIRGNHDEEFAACIDLMRQTDRTENLATDPCSASDATALYDTTKYLLRTRSPAEAPYFDLYGTIGRLLDNSGVNLSVLTAWADMIRAMPFFVRFPIGDRICIVVHAGYREGGFANEAEAAEFYLYAREETYRKCGIDHGMVISGHTPTVIRGTPSFNDGKVFRCYGRAKDCVFYDIDCGCAFRKKYPHGRLACLRVEDETAFYV